MIRCGGGVTLVANGYTSQKTHRDIIKSDQLIFSSSLVAFVSFLILEIEFMFKRNH